MRLSARSFAIALLLIIAVAGASAHEAHHHAAKHAQPRTNLISEQDIPEVAIDLVDHLGRKVSFDQLLGGGPFILSFSYLNCPSQCPTSDLIMSQASLKAEERQPDLRFVTLTLDPDRDDVRALAKHHAELGSPTNWLWATGEPGAMRRLLRRLGVVSGPLEEHGVLFLVGNAGTGRMTRNIGLPDAAGDLLALAERHAISRPR